MLWPRPFCVALLVAAVTGVCAGPALADDTVAPQLSVSGALTDDELAPTWANGLIRDVGVLATDVDSGVATISASVDGVETTGGASPMSNPCQSAGCPLNALFSFDDSDWVNGTHDLQLRVTDRAGNSTSRTWTVTLDRLPLLRQAFDPSYPWYDSPGAVAVRDGVAEGLLRFVGLNPPTTGSSARSARAARTTDAGDGGLGDLDGGGFNPVASDFSGETPQGQLNGHGILALPERPNGKEIERQVMHVGGQTGVLHPPQTGIASFTGPGFQEYDWQLGTGPQARRIKLNVPGNAYDIGPYPFNCVQSVPEGTPLTPGPGDVATAPDDGYWLAGCGTNYIAVWPANDGDCPTFTVVAPTGWTKVKGEDVQCGFYVEQPDHTVIWTEVTGERDAFFMPWWETVDGFWDGSPPWWQWKYSDPSPLDLDGFTGKLGPAINDPANPEFNTFGNNTVNSEGEGDDEGIGEGPLENPDRDPDTAYPRIPDDAQIAAMATHALEDDKHAKDFDGDTTAEKIANAEARIRDAVEDGKVWALPRGRTGFTRVGEPHVIIHTPVRGSDGTHNPNQGTIFIPDNGETPEDYMKRQQRDRPDRNLGA